MRPILLTLGLLFVSSACGSAQALDGGSGGGAPTTGGGDGATGGGGGSVLDGGPDGGGEDGGSSEDAGVLDSGIADSGVPEDGGADSGVQSDAGRDASVDDAGLDASVPDAGTDGGQDAGEPDAGPYGESCGNPLVLSPVNSFDGGYELEARISPSLDDFQNGCAPDAGPDTVIQLDIAQTSDVFVFHDPSPSGGWASFDLRTSDCRTSLQCRNRQNLQFGISSIQREALAPGRYFLAIELLSGAFIDLRIVVRTTGPNALNDECSGAIPLVFTSGAAHADGTSIGATTTGLVGDATPSCDALRPSRDVVYAYTLTQPADVSIAYRGFLATRPTGRSVHVRKVCTVTARENEVGCSRFLNNDGPMVLFNQPAGTYYVWVATGAEPSFTLDVSLSPPTTPPENDECQQATMLFSDGGVFDRVNGSTLAGTTTASIACQHIQQGSADVFFRLQTSTPQKLEAIARPTATDGGVFRPTLALMPFSNCLTDGGVLDAGLLGCRRGFDRAEAMRLTVSEIPAGDYLLVIQGAASQGPFELEATLSAPSTNPQNSSCANTLPLQLDPSGHAEIRGTTRGAADDHLGLGCNALPGTPDVIYSLTTPATARTSAGFAAFVQVFSENLLECDPRVFVNLLCESSYSSQRACGASDLALREARALATELQPATTYYIYAEASESSRGAGPFTLWLDLEEPPLNDRCETATPLPLNTTVRGSVIAAARDYDSTNVYLGPCTAPNPGPDVAYSFVPQTSGRYEVALVPMPGINLFASVLEDSCDLAGRCIAQSLNMSPDQSYRVSFEGQAGRTYFLLVDSNTSGGGNQLLGPRVGAFTISISQ